jgi:hypothetical protein
MPGPHRQHVRARTLDWHSMSFGPTPAQFVAKKVSHRTFISSDGFNIDKPTGEGKQVHAGKA